MAKQKCSGREQDQSDVTKTDDISIVFAEPLFFSKAQNFSLLLQSPALSLFLFQSSSLSEKERTVFLSSVRA